jgi:hypothetical protein
MAGLPVCNANTDNAIINEITAAMTSKNSDLFDLNVLSFIAYYCSDACYKRNHQYSKCYSNNCRACGEEYTFNKVVGVMCCLKCPNGCRSGLNMTVNCNNYDMIYKHHEQGKACFCENRKEDEPCPWFRKREPIIETQKVTLSNGQVVTSCPAHNHY